MSKKPSVSDILTNELNSPIKLRHTFSVMYNSIIAGSFLFNYVHGIPHQGDLDIFMTDDIALDETPGSDPVTAIYDILKKVSHNNIAINKKIVEENLSTYHMSCSKYALSFNSRSTFLSVFRNLVWLSPSIDKIERFQLIFYSPHENEPKHSTKEELINYRKSSIIRNFDFLHCMPYFDIDEQRWYTNDVLNKIIEEKILILSSSRIVNENTKERYRKFIARGMSPSHRTQKLIKL